MRLPRMTIRRWMVATAIVAAVCGEALRVHALQLRVAFHAREKQSCLRRAQAIEIEQRRWEKAKDRWCGLADIFVEMEELYEAIPVLRERAAYHAELEAKHRRAVLYPWILAPAEKPFLPDDRARSPGWLRARAKAYQSLEQGRRALAKIYEERGELDVAAIHIRRAEEHAEAVSDYDRRARQRESHDASVP